jgi:hypothetical protein
MTPDEYREMVDAGNARLRGTKARRGRSTWERADGTPSENGEARTLAWWLRRARRARDGRKVRFCHVANEATSRHPAVSAILRAMGLESGAPDYLIFTRPAVVCVAGWPDYMLEGAPARAWHERVAFAGVALELKAATRPSVSRNQKEADAFLAELRDVEGWFAMRVLGADRAIATLTRLGFTGPAFDGRFVR